MIHEFFPTPRYHQPKDRQNFQENSNHTRCEVAITLSLTCSKISTKSLGIRGADPTFIKRIVDTGAANVIYLSPGAEELNELPVIRKCVMEYRQNSPVVKKDTLLFVKIFSASPVWGGNKFNPALHLVQIGFCSSKAETTDTSTRKPFTMIVRNEVPNINSTESGSSQRDMDPRHHKIPYFVVSSGRKGSDTAVPYLQKLEKNIFLNKIPSGKGQH